MIKMMIYRNHKYSVYTTDNMVVAITHYGGRRIRAVAKCAPSDTFDAELGAQLAMARCAQKVEKIRQRNLNGHIKTWSDVVSMANKELEEVTLKRDASVFEANMIEKAIENILAKA